MRLTDIVTDDSNETLQPAYVLGLIAFLIGVGLEIYCTIKHLPFDLQAYGIGIGALIAGIEGGKKLGS